MQLTRNPLIGSISLKSVVGIRNTESRRNRTSKVLGSEYDTECIANDRISVDAI